MSLPRISPAKAKELIDAGAILLDIRELDEHARSRIPAARHAPLSRPCQGRALLVELFQHAVGFRLEPVEAGER